MTARYIRVESCRYCLYREFVDQGNLNGFYVCSRSDEKADISAYRTPGQFPSWCPLMTEDELQFVGKVQVTHD